MAVGDMTADTQSIAAGAYLAIQPAGTVEWVIHNITHESDVELHSYDGTNDIKADAHFGFGGWFGYFLHCNNADYYRVKNNNTASKLIHYDGVITHT